MFRYKTLFIFLCLCGWSFGQVGVNSPYSSLGIGSTKIYGNAYLSALGGITTGLNDSSVVNTYNPSTYAMIASQRPLFSFGLNHYETSFIANNGLTTKDRFTGITHLAIAIPFASRFGLAFGLKPFSRRGYSINGYDMVNNDSIHYSYEGKGGIYNVFLGFSANIIENLHHTLSAGVNGMYYFGHVDNVRRAYQKMSDGREKGGIDTKRLRARTLGYEVALNYNYRPNREQSFRITGVYRPSNKGKFDRSYTQSFYGDFLSLASYDTVVATGDRRGEVYIPSKLAIGFTYIFTPNRDSSFRRVKYPSFLFSFEYSKEDWGNYSANFDGVSYDNGVFINSDAYRFGFEYSPHRFAFRRSNYVNFFDKIKYRVGAYWRNTPYQTGGTQLVDKGVTLGFGFPIAMHRSISTLNVSFNYGEMNGGGAANDFKQRYFGVNLGFNIAPGFDRWFRKYKLD